MADPGGVPFCQNVHKNDRRTVSCKLASKPLFGDTSVAKPTVEAVVDSIRSLTFFSIIGVYFGISLWLGGWLF